MKAEEIIDIDPEYLKGFNNGYVVAKEQPKKFDELMKSKNLDSQYFKGVKAGGREYLKEKFKDELQNVSERREHTRDKEREKE